MPSVVLIEEEEEGVGCHQCPWDCTSEEARALGARCAARSRPDSLPGSLLGALHASLSLLSSLVGSGAAPSLLGTPLDPGAPSLEATASRLPSGAACCGGATPAACCTQALGRSQRSSLHPPEGEAFLGSPGRLGVRTCTWGLQGRTLRPSCGRPCA